MNLFYRHRLRVRGTEDLELAYKIVQPDGNFDTLSVGLRHAIGLVRLSGDDANDRDLRLVQESALDRPLADKTLRPLASELAKSEVTETTYRPCEGCSQSGRSGFQVEKSAWRTGPSDNRRAGPVDHKADRTHNKREGVQLPLASGRSGTRRFAAVALRRILELHLAIPS